MLITICYSLGSGPSGGKCIAGGTLALLAQTKKNILPFYM